MPQSMTLESEGDWLELIQAWEEGWNRDAEPRSHGILDSLDASRVFPWSDLHLQPCAPDADRNNELVT